MCILTTAVLFCHRRAVNGCQLSQFVKLTHAGSEPNVDPGAGGCVASVLQISRAITITNMVTISYLPTSGIYLLVLTNTSG